MQNKRLYIIGGCNGAGKTTARMKNSELKEIRDRIIEGMKISAQKFILKKKRLGQKIVISENGNIQVIEASDLN